MFHFLEAATADERTSELERFVEWWYGKRRPAYGEPQDRLHALPTPLKRFYAFAGRWPAPGRPEQFFYTGGGIHHLRNLDSHSVRKDDKLNFFMEYQGDWHGLTLTAGDDPPVWISGRLDWSSRQRIRKVSDSLSAFLVTHILMVTAYDDWNATRTGSASGSIDSLIAAGERPVRIWSAEGCTCPNYDGEFFLLNDAVLIHQSGSFLQLAAIRPAGAECLRQLLPLFDDSPPDW